VNRAANPTARGIAAPVSLFLIVLVLIPIPILSFAERRPQVSGRGPRATATWAPRLSAATIRRNHPPPPRLAQYITVDLAAQPYCRWRTAPDLSGGFTQDLHMPLA